MQLLTAPLRFVRNALLGTYRSAANARARRTNVLALPAPIMWSFPRSLPAIVVLAISTALLAGCAKRVEPGASQDAAVQSGAAASAQGLGPLTAPPNKDFRLTSAPKPMRKVGAVVADTSGQGFVEVLGVDVPDRVRVNEPFVVRTYFKVLASTTEDLEISLHLFSPTAKGLFNGDHAPMAGGYRTPQWKPGELLVDEAAARLERAGSYNLFVILQAQGKTTKILSGESGYWGIPAGAVEAE